jgi:hypothetical protein
MKLSIRPAGVLSSVQIGTGPENIAFDLGDRQACGVIMNERLDVGLAHRVATAFLGDKF